jgi:hypothetical protein
MNNNNHGRAQPSSVHQKKAKDSIPNALFMKNPTPCFAKKTGRRVDVLFGRPL